MNSRRTFLVSAGAAASQVLARKAAASDRVRVAVLGVNGRGRDHIEGFQGVPGTEVALLCDPDSKILAERAAQFQEKYGRKVETANDLRKVFERKDIDAVGIATPNHWHSLAGIWACQAGKDVYVEKPASHNVFEGRKLVEAAHKYKRIVQHGVQLRSSDAIQEAVQLLRKGVIGKVYMARGLVYRWRPSIGHKPTEPVPAYLDYDLWTGPAQQRPFSRRLVHYNWHWHWDYGNGDVGNQGIHETDMCMWGLDVGLPKRITAMGGKFLFDDDKETPEILSSVYHYPEEKKIIQFEVRHWCTNEEHGVGVGNIFYGSEGYMLIRGYNTYEVYLGQKREKGPSGKSGGDHYANFIKAVRSRKTSDQNGPVETAHLSSALAHLGNISFRLGRQLTFDPATEKFVGDSEADAMLTRNYRTPFVVPEKV
ncbi:MAG: Gfo/Idh/MocA family oxidoreductase [Bryobacterales bacterium]|nr:Gfo/Idh/MocA family oxidoreductase [Bryobacterales bacterium]MEB2363286.1 Gfo/Idh/MocA family oxidoreductase [Bryobacterales bacterium]